MTTPTIPRPPGDPGSASGRGGPVEEWSAGGVVVRRIDGRLHALLIRDPYRNWGLPKGHLEEGEDALQAATREVAEETGLEELEVGPELGTIDWFFRSRRRRVHKFCTFFLMASPRGEVEPDTSEGISECVWLPIEEAVERITYDNARETLRRAAEKLEASPPPFDL